ncbi:hypothetical protein DFH06DRAFT_1134362 [Mycena polygramma]|nr:hypothetical protein DFH06DRAFT_1134362 [Mycena polygramma]
MINVQWMRTLRYRVDVCIFSAFVTKENVNLRRDTTRATDLHGLVEFNFPRLPVAASNGMPGLPLPGAMEMHHHQIHRPTSMVAPVERRCTATEHSIPPLSDRILGNGACCHMEIPWLQWQCILTPYTGQRRLRQFELYAAMLTDVLDMNYGTLTKLDSDGCPESSGSDKTMVFEVFRSTDLQLNNRIPGIIPTTPFWLFKGIYTKKIAQCRRRTPIRTEFN